MLVGVAHAPFVRAGVLSWALARLRTDAGLRVEIGDLDYNLAALTGTLRNVTIAAVEADMPFFHADLVRVDLPWAVVRGSTSIQSLEIEHPRITIVRQEDGVLNLPQTAGSAAHRRETAAIDAVQIERLMVRSLELRYEDRPRQMFVDGRGVTLALPRSTGAMLEGRVSMSDGVTIRVADRETNISRLEGRFAFDGTALAVEELAIESPEGQLRLDGTVTLLPALRLSNLQYAGRADLGRIAPWLRVDHAPRGTVSFSGRVDGMTATVESLRAALGGGEVTGEARLPLDENGLGRARFRWRDIELGQLAEAAADLPVRVASTADGTATLEWNGRDVLAARGAVESLLRAASAPGEDAVAISGRAELLLDGDGWLLTHDHRLGTAVALSGSASGRIDRSAPLASTLSGRVSLRVADLRDALRDARALGLALNADGLPRLQGALSADAVLAGVIGSPRAEGTLRAADVRYGGAGPGDASAAFAATASGITIDPLQLAMGPNTIGGRAVIDLDTSTINGELTADLSEIAALAVDVPPEWRPAGSARLTATGRYALSSGRYTFAIAGDGLAIAAVPEGTDAPGLPLDARFDLRMSGEGTMVSPQANGFVQFSRLSWDEFEVGPTRLEIATDQERLHLTGTAPQIPASLKAQVGLGAPRSFTADLSLLDANLSRLAPPAVLAGSLSLRARASGRLDDLANAVADIDVRIADVAVNGARIILPRPARLRYARGGIFADDLELRVGETVLSAMGRFGAGSAGADAWRVGLTGSLDDLLPVIRLVPGLDEIDASGAIDLQARAAGGPDAPQVDAAFSIGPASFRSGTMPPVSDVVLEASYARGLLDLRELRAGWQGATLTASGQLPAGLFRDRLPGAYRRMLPDAPGRAHVEMRVASLTQNVLAPFVSQEIPPGVAGRFDAVVSLAARSLDIEALEGDITLERAELTLARVPLHQTRPTRVRLAGGRLEVIEWAWGGSGNRIDLAGNALLTGDVPDLDLAVTGTLDLRMLGAFSPDIAADGVAAFDLEATGAADRPELDGQLSFQDGSLIVRDPRVAITDLQGAVVFSGDALKVTGMTASANGGTLHISGDVRYPQLEPAGTIAVTGRGLAFEMPEHLRSELDADLELVLSPVASSLAGSVTILRGSYREPISLVSQLRTGVETLPAGATATAEPGFADRMALRIDVTSAEDIGVDNNYFRLDVSSNLRIEGTLGEPVVTGRLTVQEGGDVYLGGRTYEVLRGTVDFTSMTRIEPTLDLALQTQVQRNDIILEVSGTPDTIEASLSSPGLSQADVVSLLLTGQSADETAVAQTEIARGQLLMLLSGELLGFAGRAVGLDAVRIGRGLGAAASDFDLLATDTDPSARLTIGKNLSRDVEIVFSQSLRETGDTTWIATYRPVRHIEIRGATQDDGSRSYEFRHELNLGGSAARPTAPAERSGRSAERVAAVRILGAPGFAEREIWANLRLEPGDPFDFYQWQDDRDRLQRFYCDREFLEARISARRGGADRGMRASSIALEYEIHRGPRTTLTVEGHALPDALIESMKEAWAAAVFDGFLLEDLRSMARDQMLRDGYLRADVTVEIVSTADSAAKEIAVRISPGTRFADRRIRFSGQDRFSAAALDEVVQARGVGSAMWVDPSGLEGALEEFYRSQGHVEAAVAAGVPIFSGQSATLPVRVEEGRLFTIARVEVRGARAEPDADVLRTFGIAGGTPYLPAALDAARRRVELFYLREGYAGARVSVTTLVDEGRARIDVALDIDEGPQQVLAGVDVSGARITSHTVVERALDLEPGQPIDLADFYRAQKRLYDTGLFRTADIKLEPVDDAGSAAVRAMRARVSLEELPPYRLRYGIRLNDEVGPAEADREVRPALVVDVLRRNLFGRAIATGVAGQIEADRRLARGIVTLPRMFGLPVTSSLYVSTSRQDFRPEGGTPFVEDQSGITAQQRWHPTPRAAVTYGYSFSRTRVFEPKPTPGLPGLDLRADIARLTGTYAWDRRDDSFDAREGGFHSSGLELGAASLGSDLRFVKYLAQQRYFKTIGDGVVLASAFRLGAGSGFDQDLIPSEKFFAGGGTSVRGFAEDGLGEVNFFGDPAGGNGMLLLNQELRFPIYEWARGVIFGDAGSVFPNAGDIALADLEAGAGLGLRIASPFALFRVDFGMPLTRREREPFGRWYVGIGHAF